MSHEIQQREHEGIVILDFKGRITVGPEASALRDKVAAVTAAGSKNIILNLAHVDYIDSTGLGALVIPTVCGPKVVQGVTLTGTMGGLINFAPLYPPMKFKPPPPMAPPIK